ncbi:hypothetical protein [Oryzomonas rubra]|uniref:Uncharacterized protein n=1 Tax=Oryzomonas rubra TaxID=2509454 RepID=A0A5A9X8G2_9BACT|nr:hypothetical protein [Oryzomonas rubra]KAA0888768.1 hypothetical protein ET418_15420 [Oryzomonas rubra]
MSIQLKTSFNIENAICPTTGKPFGSKYAGTFTIRRPSLLDKKNISVKNAASMSAAGTIAAGTMDKIALLISYIFSFVTTVNEEELPAWFNMADLYDGEDEDAVFAVWDEVQNYLNSFRPKDNSGNGPTGDGQATVLVPKDVQPAAD